MRYEFGAGGRTLFAYGVIALTADAMVGKAVGVVGDTVFVRFTDEAQLDGHETLIIYIVKSICTHTDLVLTTFGASNCGQALFVGVTAIV